VHIKVFEIQLSEGERDPINPFNPATYLYLSQTRTWISNDIFRALLCDQLYEMRDNWSFCWCWWNCWPLLFKLCFHGGL